MDSTLGRSRIELESEVGSFLGFGYGEEFGDRAWTARQTRFVQSDVKSGLARFYQPSPALTKGEPVVWSFLHPTADLTLLSGARSIPLPYNFGGVDAEEITVTNSSNQMFLPIRIEGIGKIDNLFAMNAETTGRPQCAALVPLKGVTNERGQRFELQVYPIADAQYNLRLYYYFLPNYPDGTEAYPYGGAEHSETILESCLAVAEERRDNQPGVHLAAFQRQLLASIQLDRKKKPQRIGYNGDRSDDIRYYDRADLARAVTINGIAYD